MSKNRKNLTVVLVVIVVGLMVLPAFARREYRPALVGPTRWISVSEPAYEGRDQSTQPVATVEQKSDLANAIDGVAGFVGDTAETVGVAFGETVEATGEFGGGIIEGTGAVVGDTAGTVGTAFGNTVEAAGGIVEGTGVVVGEAGGGILTWVGDVAGAAGDLVGETWDFLFGGWG